MLSSIQKMLEEFEKNQIIYCHWKSNIHLKESLNGETDLDMLFVPEQRTKLEIVLDSCGLKRFRATPLMQYEAIEDFIGFDQETAVIWHLHTHYNMTFGEKHLKGYKIIPWARVVLNHRRLSKEGVYCAAFEDELMLLFVRIALKLRWRDIGHRLSKEDRNEFLWLQERIDIRKFRKTADKMLEKRSADIILKLLTKQIEKKNQFIPLHKELLREFSFFTGYSRFGSWYNRTKREVFWIAGGIKRRLGFNSYSALRRISPAGGCVVTFLGCDGSGKSTTLAYVKKEFSKKIDVVSIYFGSGDGSSSLLRKPMKLIAKKVGGKGIGQSVELQYEKDNSQLSIKAKIYSLAKILWAVSLAREKKKKLQKMVKARNQGILVLTDRYPQSIVSGYSDGPLLTKYENRKGIMKKISDWEKNIYKLAKINPPDLIIKLTVPTDIAIRRKPEMTINEVERKKRVIEAMHISAHSVDIDTSCAFEQTRKEAMQAIWNLI